MTNPANGFPPDGGQIQGDSLNSDIVEVTTMEVDNTVRPMRDSLRKRLKAPPSAPPETPSESPDTK